MRKCIKCEIEFELSNFYFRKDNSTYRSECKKCFQDSRKQYLKSYKEDNHELIKEKNKKYNNSDEVKEKNRLWREQNKEHLLDYHKEYKISNTDRISKINQNYYLKNKDRILDYGRKYKNEKYKMDNLYKLSVVIRSNINYTIKNLSENRKQKRTEEILGCSFEDFKLYFESKFETWMNWCNQGLYNGELDYGWDIDHIIPISSAKNEEEIIELNHYTNLQPLCSKINRDIKRNKI